jgi:hypothetical protein
MEVRMNRIFVIACVSLAASACTMNQSADPRAEQAGEARIAAALEGYEQAGPPTSCVQEYQLGGNRSAGDAIIFQGRTSGTLYVNRPAGGCPPLGYNNALITRSSGSQLCRGDIARVFDPVSHTEFGGCALGDFTPYRRIPRR